MRGFGLRAAATAAACVLLQGAALAAEKPAKSEAQSLAEEGYDYLKTGRYVEAIYDLQKAADLAPQYAFLYYDLGIAYYNLGQYDRALAFYDKALSLRKDYASALVNKGDTLLKLKRMDEALAAYDKALELEPNADDIRVHRGYFFASQGKHDKAIEEYTVGVKINPGNGQGQYWLAKSYAETGKPADAWEHVHAAQKAGYAVDKEFLRDLTFQIPEPHDSKPETAAPAGQGPIVTEKDLANLRRDHEKTGDFPPPNDSQPVKPSDKK